jgi:molybdate-binding protein/DNA-binding XRE family transcriptional regulator
MTSNNLSALRQRRGIAAAELARLAGVSRQTIYAIEAGTFIPNTAVALKLAQILETPVEQIFFLEGAEPSRPLASKEAELLPGSEVPVAGQPLQLCRVANRLVASPPSAVPWYFPASDAVAAVPPLTRGRMTVEAFDPDAEYRNRLLIAGCDPGISVLARHMQAAGVEMVMAHRNSSQSLQLLKESAIHVAGTHLRDESTGDSNVAEIERLFPRQSVAIISFSVWEEGIVTARSNPKEIRGVEDLARKGITIMNREEGAGARKLLDTHLAKLGIPARDIEGYGREAPGHLPAAWQVRTGEADACIATRAAARSFGLGFIPLASERYDLAIRRPYLDLPSVRTLLDTLNRSAFRRELESLGGYDTRAAGERRL